jgi:Fungal trichothecene efflux pump (TRI12)
MDRNVPIGGVACAIILIFLQLHGAGKENRRLPFSAKLQHLDFGGAVTLIAGVACLLIALQWGGHKMPWRSAKVIGLFISSGLLVILFGLIQWRRGERATIPLRIIRQRSILFGCIYVALLDMAAYAVRIPTHA